MEVENNLTKFNFNIEKYGKENSEIVIKYINSLSELEC